EGLIRRIQFGAPAGDHRDDVLERTRTALKDRAVRIDRGDRAVAGDVVAFDGTAVGVSIRDESRLQPDDAVCVERRVVPTECPSGDGLGRFVERLPASPPDAVVARLSVIE